MIKVIKLFCARESKILRCMLFAHIIRASNKLSAPTVALNIMPHVYNYCKHCIIKNWSYLEYASKLAQFFPSCPDCQTAKTTVCGPLQITISQQTQAYKENLNTTDLVEYS